MTGRSGRTGDGDGAGRTGDGPQPPTLPWTTWRPGDRVVVRYRTADGLHDALGELLSTAPDGVLVRTRRGDVHVHAQEMVTGKRVPPPPRRPGSPPA
ncbi:hypothetical protein PU560_04295 [Georgenia sp. 10Sc9-8]|uniref:Histone acetyltransferase Rv0428c-like SH3 domain-containing protein n=1 Tax=Georgenia halotolerans TaxID=3028317 RepID=A0ABT5TX08_9MICO|nr:hypothetical protein [Georgenia halotolerans]